MSEQTRSSALIQQPCSLQARRWVRRMRGRTHSDLVEGSDGHLYVVKYRQNPLGPRVLVNEFLCSIFLDAVGIGAPEPAFVEINEGFLNERAGAINALAEVGVRPGVHFGSRYPDAAAYGLVYDFLPDAFLGRVVNRNDFFGLLVFDQWISQADERQMIFFRQRLNGATRWVARAVDHEGAFQHTKWVLRDSSIAGLYPRQVVYGSNPTSRSVRPWVEKFMSIPDWVFEEAFNLIPKDWFAKDERACAALLEHLRKRRERIPALVREPIKYLASIAGHAGSAAKRSN